jgi:hypothetical protein
LKKSKTAKFLKGIILTILLTIVVVPLEKTLSLSKVTYPFSAIYLFKSPFIADSDKLADERPLISITGYSLDPENPKPGDEFSLSIALNNTGSLPAEFLVIDFSSDKFVPLHNGGKVFIQKILPSESIVISQTFVVPDNATTGIQTMNIMIEYNTIENNTFSDTFAIAVDIYKPSPTAEAPYVFIPTPTSTIPPQIIINGFSILLANGQPLKPGEFLEPGSHFILNLNLMNIGREKASNIIMALGGATYSENGLGGAVGNFSIFSPVNAANIIPINNIEAGSSIQVSQSLTVNNAVDSGSYNLQISFIYSNLRGEKIIDDQIVSLQVLVQPKIQVGLYTSIETAYIYQQMPIPLMITNLSPQTIQLGELDISCNGWDITPKTAYIGKIDSGEQWFPPGEFIGSPIQVGTTTCTIIINYLDDFGNKRQILDSSLILTSEQEAFNPESLVSPEESQIIPQMEDPVKNKALFKWNTLFRAILGFLGLDGNAGNTDSFETTTSDSPSKKP